MSIDDCDPDDEDAPICPRESYIAPDFEAIAVHPLVPQGMSPALWGQLWAFIRLHSAEAMALQDDRFFSTFDHEDAALHIGPSIRACRDHIVQSLKALHIEELHHDEVIETLCSALHRLYSEHVLLAELRTNARPRVSYSRAYELPLDAESQRQCEILLEEILVCRHGIRWCMEVSALAADPKGPVCDRDRFFLSNKYGVAQKEPHRAQGRRVDCMAGILETALHISSGDAEASVEGIILDAYPDRFPLDVPSSERSRQQWQLLLAEQKQLRREEKHWERIIADGQRGW